MEQNVVVNDYTAMDRILKEERKYLLKLVKQIAATGEFVKKCVRLYGHSTRVENVMLDVCKVATCC